MKLYATTTSERATKGQGGNERLNINININSELPTYTVNVFRNETTGQTKIEFLAKEFDKWNIKYSTIEFENIEQKGNKQKSENYANPQIAHNIWQGEDWHN